MSSRRLDQEEFILPIDSSLEGLIKAFLRRHDQDQYIRLSKISSQDILKTSSRCLQDVFKTPSRRLAKMSSKHLQDVLKTSH